MATKKKDYSIRTLSYYLQQGGIYNDIITVLQRVRTQPGTRIMAPNKVLNMACTLFDACLEGLDTETQTCYEITDIMADYFGGHHGAGIFSGLPRVDEEAVYSVWTVLLSQEPLFVEIYLSDLQEWLKDSKVFASFKDLLNVRLNSNHTDESFTVKKLKMELALKDETIKALTLAKDEEIATLHHQVEDERRKAVEALEQLAEVQKVSKLDKMVNFSSAKKYMERMRKYERVNQILDMVQDLTRGKTTEQEEQDIQNLKDFLLSEDPKVVHYHNENKESVVLQGLVKLEGYPFAKDPKEFLTWAFEAYKSYAENGKKG